MNTIWKFPLRIDDEQIVTMPAVFRVLCVQVQRGVPCLWVMVDESSSPRDVSVSIRGTGHDVSGIPPDDYVGTFQVADGALIFHVFLSRRPA